MTIFNNERQQSPPLLPNNEDSISTPVVRDQHFFITVFHRTLEREQEARTSNIVRLQRRLNIQSIRTTIEYSGEYGGRIRNITPINSTNFARPS